MLRDFSIQAMVMGLLAAFVGFVSSFAVIMQGLSAMGAGPDQVASALLVLSVLMGVLGILLPLWLRMPISVAWSTPGAALLSSVGMIEGGFPAAAGAFVLCGGLIVLSGLFSPLGRAIRMIPAPLANAMLSGILVNLCLAPVKAVAFNPWLGLPIVATWMLVVIWKRLWAVPAALLAFALVLVFGVDLPPDVLSRLGQSIHPQLLLVVPVFTLHGFISVAVPLFIVTMASQNIPGIAILKVNGYEPPPNPLFVASGLFSAIGAAFGAVPVNLAAITAAMCASEEAHHDPKRRYWSAIVAGIAYIFFGLLASGIIAFVALSPPILLQAVAGLALIGAFSSAAQAAFRDADTREAAAITFLVTASGTAFAGVSGAFWGLIAGAVMLGLKRMATKG
ncbi:benzoate/H(+) symporter BenE family transporter [Rhizobium straminoryzae]|uniref:Benzoate/H(+) symporter BenE family transporter n=1 Tax=Rhizobium straminoryzae TaxID=1387186 RepID=A0A549TDH3_9HYPH|nr:benzoate/H(+) symporter BenE family transporter [Rhizobium straminoryzae]TRL40104.1 benzoate/H(+) symporter BenE family transporter [Rhizobium straminoryzae]